MTWNTPAASSGNSDLVRERMISDLIAGERALKESALAISADFRRVLYTVAQKIDGGQVQSLLRSDPTTFQSYSPAQWQAFFERALSDPAGGWRSSTAEPRLAVTEALEQQIAKLRQDLETERRRAAELQNQLGQARQAVQPDLPSILVKEPVLAPKAVQARPEQKPAPVSQRKPEQKPEHRPASGKGWTKMPVQPKADDEPTHFRALPKDERPIRVQAQDEVATWLSPGLYTEIITRMTNWQPPAIPNRYRNSVDKDEMKWRRQSMALFIMATYGISVRLELDYLISRLENLKSRTTSLRETLDVLNEKGMTVGGDYRLQRSEFETALKYMRLSQDGRVLCEALGWKAIESDWERILRIHEGDRQPEHMFCLLAFNMHARLRGWRSTLLPDVSGSARPDVMVEKDGERHYVEVETADKEKSDKWRNQADLQGHVALCPILDDQRTQLVSDCKAMKLKGVASDLKTLVKQRLPDIGPDTSLWLETW